MADHSISPKRAYVYAILVDGVVRYIGKGTGKRSTVHIKIARAILRRRHAGEKIRTTRFYNRLVKSLARGAIVENRIIVSGLTDEWAFIVETREIAVLPKRQLWNVQEGGEGFTAAGLKPWTSSARFKALKRNAMQARMADPEYKQLVCGLAQESEVRARATANAIATKSTSEWKEKQGASLRNAWSDPIKRERMLANRSKEKLVDAWKVRRERGYNKSFFSDPTYQEKQRRNTSARWAMAKSKGKNKL